MRNDSKKFITRNLKEHLPKVADYIAKTSSPKSILAGLNSEYANLDAPVPEGAAYWSCLESSAVKALTDQHPRLMELTNCYYKGIGWSSLSHRPFEVFILQDTFRSICGPFSNGIYTRNMLLNDCASWSPFLRELIIDTCNYIVTGRRDIDIAVLGNLSVDYAVAIRLGKNPAFPEFNVQQRFKWSDIENMTSHEFFTCWITQRRGVEDMQYAHRIMLGY